MFITAVAINVHDENCWSGCLTIKGLCCASPFLSQSNVKLLVSCCNQMDQCPNGNLASYAASDDLTLYVQNPLSINYPGLHPAFILKILIPVPVSSHPSYSRCRLYINQTLTLASFICRCSHMHEL